MKKTGLLFIIALVCFSCQNKVEENKINEANIEKWKQEVYNMELAFAEHVKNEGFEKGFAAYGAEDAVLKRRKRFLIGLDSITTYYAKNKPTSGTETLSWKPDFVDVSSSGDLAYTYGKATYTYTDSLGVTKEYPGTFHTVWKRQKDGSWKYVYD